MARKVMLGKVLVCEICEKEYTYYGPPGTTKLCSHCHGIEKYYKSKNDKIKVLKKEMGGKCCVCGFSDYQEALHFHHKDQSTKKINITREWSRSLATLREETKKCILVCANCHAHIHQILRDMEYSLL